MHILQQLDIFQGKKGFAASVGFAQIWPALDREFGGEKSHNSQIFSGELLASFQIVFTPEVTSVVLLWALLANI